MTRITNSMDYRRRLKIGRTTDEHPELLERRQRAAQHVAAAPAPKITKQPPQSGVFVDPASGSAVVVERGVVKDVIPPKPQAAAVPPKPTAPETVDMMAGMQHLHGNVEAKQTKHTETKQTDVQKTIDKSRAVKDIL